MRKRILSTLGARLQEAMLILAVFGGFFLLPSHAEDSPVTIEIQKDEEVDKNAHLDDKLGNTVESVKKRRFLAQVESKSMEPLNGLEIRLYVIGVENNYEPDAKRLHMVQGAFRKEGINLEFGEKKEIDMGEVEFRSMEAKNSGTFYKGGIIYYGLLTEVYFGGNKVAEKLEGKRDMIRNAIDDYQRANAKKSTKP